MSIAWFAVKKSQVPGKVVARVLRQAQDARWFLLRVVRKNKACSLDETQCTKFDWIEFTRHIPVTRTPGHHRKRDVQN